MKKIAVAVFDMAAELWSTPMYFQTVGIAVRAFNDEVNRQDENNPYYKHPGDYALYLIGEWLEDDGVFVNNESGNRLLLRGVEARAAKERKETN